MLRLSSAARVRSFSLMHEAKGGRRVSMAAISSSTSTASYLGHECGNEGAISHFSLFQQGRAKGKESRRGRSVQRGKGRREGPESLGDSNVLRHNARLGRGDRSDYSRTQARRAEERQSPSDNRSLGEKPQNNFREKSNQGYYCSFVHPPVR